MVETLPFNKPTFLGSEISAVQDLMQNPEKHSERFYTRVCKDLLSSFFTDSDLYLCNSASSALDMVAQLVPFEDEDEIIVPSFTFVSAANAFVNEGFTPVFADIEPDTLSVSAKTIEPLITNKTKAIMMMHYGGNPSDIEAVVALAKKNNLLLIEDASHCVGVKYNSRGLGSFGDFGILSFDSTKNITSGHGGLLVLNNSSFESVANELYEIGTNKAAFLEDKVPYYEWVNKGRKYGMSEVNAAMLSEQLKLVKLITDNRRVLWEKYSALLGPLQEEGLLELPKPKELGNAHTFYVLLKSELERVQLRKHLKENGVIAVSHYIPLHDSKMGMQYLGNCPVTSDMSRRLLRLPLYYGLNEVDVEFVCSKIATYG